MCGVEHPHSLCASTALALLLVHTGQLEQAATLYHAHGELGLHNPREMLQDARALVGVLRERGEEAEATLVERMFRM
jgi:hypothetical protein